MISKQFSVQYPQPKTQLHDKTVSFRVRREAETARCRADAQLLLAALDRAGTGLTPAYLELLTGLPRRRVGMLLSDASRDGRCIKARSGNRIGLFVYRSVS